MRVLPWDSSPRLLREYGAVRGDSGERGADMMVELRRGSDVYRLCAGLGRARRRNAHAVNQQFVVEFYNFDLLKRTRSVRDAERRTERRTERMPRSSLCCASVNRDVEVIKQPPTGAGHGPGS